LRGSTVNQGGGGSVTAEFLEVFANNNINLAAKNNYVDRLIAVTGTDGGEGLIQFANGGDITLDFLQTINSPVTVTSSGNINVGRIIAGTSTVTLTSTNGAILDNQTTAFADIAAANAILSAPGGIGTFANPLETQVQNISLTSIGISEPPPALTGGLVLPAELTNEIGIINTGPLTIDALNFSGAIAAVGSTTTLALANPINVTGSLGLGAGTSMTIDKSVSATGDLFLQSPLLTISGGAVASGANVGLSGSTINVTGATAHAYNLMTVDAANLNVTSEGLVYGLEVDMTIGTLVALAGGGRISAGSVDTINIEFPTLATGGFMVNAVAGVVDPSDTGTGFFVNGAQVTGAGFPGFNVTYGTSALPPEVTQAVNQVVAATNQQSNNASSSDEEKKDENVGSTGTGQPEGAKDKKELPVCK